MILIQDSKQKQ